MAEQVKNIIYKCPHVGKKVRLNVYSEVEKKLFGKKILDQELRECDLQSMGGCNMRIDRFDSKCPAVAQAAKCTLK